MINDKIIIDHQKCTSCLSCVDSCFQNALDYEGENKKITEIAKICLQDKDFTKNLTEELLFLEAKE